MRERERERERMRENERERERERERFLRSRNIILWKEERKECTYRSFISTSFEFLSSAVI